MGIKFEQKAISNKDLPKIMNPLDNRKLTRVVFCAIRAFLLSSLKIIAWKSNCLLKVAYTSGNIMVAHEMQS